MSVSSSPHTLSAVVGKLRASGCVFAEDEALVLIASARTPAELDSMVQRRAAGLPLEQVLGWAEFCGLRISVVPGVFVPRRRTEFLARQATSLGLATRTAGPDSPAGTRTVVVDLCCGTGAVGVALADALDAIELYAVDIDPASVACARRNLAAAAGRAYVGDLYEPLPVTLRGRVDLVVANAPYVPTESIRLLPSEARVHEPRAALDGGPDGLDVVRRVAAGARSWLAPGGSVLIETSEAQAAQVEQAMASSGLIPRLARSEERNATVVIGTRPAS